MKWKEWNERRTAALLLEKYLQYYSVLLTVRSEGGNFLLYLINPESEIKILWHLIEIKDAEQNLTAYSQMH